MSGNASVTDKFAQGAFTASVLGISGHDQALDEVHESVINRQTKAALHTSDTTYIEQIAHYLPFRALLQENLRKKVIPPPTAMASKAKANNGNVMAMYKRLLDVQLFTSKSKLCNAFTGKLATPSEECGMLDCHAVGESKLLSYFTSRIMHEPSVNTPVRQETLQTMGNLRKRKKTRNHKTTQAHCVGFEGTASSGTEA